MKTKLLLAWLAFFVVRFGFAQTELISNGGFESGQTSWQLQVITPGGGISAISDPRSAHSGNNYLLMGNQVGGSQRAYQTVFIPTNAARANLRYFWAGLTSDPGGSDQFNASVANTSLASLATVDAESSQTADGTYHQVTFDMSPYIGQTVNVLFYSANLSGQTAFYVDDVSVSYVTVSNLPPNDNFTNRSEITSNSFKITADNSFAGREAAEPAHAGNAGGKSLWWSWTAPTNGTVTLTTAGSAFDTLLAVYTGEELAALAPVASNDDDATQSGAVTSRVKFAALAGTTYDIAVDGKNGASGVLSLTGSFQVDTQKPTVTISSPASGVKEFSPTVTVKGKASDNVGIASVEYRLENVAGTNAYQPATGTTSWTASVSGFVPGVNVVRVRVLDLSGNASTAARSFKFVVTSPLKITISGDGTVSPKLDGQFLEVGGAYKITAKPGAGQVFGGWSGDTNSDWATLTFIMQTNMVLQANFVPNPFLPIAGTYEGLFYNGDQIETQSSGFLTAKVASSGKFSAKALTAGKSYSFSGQLSTTGGWVGPIHRGRLSPLQVQMKVDLYGDSLLGQISDTNWIAHVTAYRETYSRTNPATAAKYTLVLPGAEDSTTQPGGESYGAATVATSGSIIFKGALADGTKVTQHAVLVGDQWPFYLSLYSGKGCAIGWLTLTNQPRSDISGTARWIKLADPKSKSKYYRGGFTNDSEVVGSTYSSSKGVPIIDVSSSQLVIYGGDLPDVISYGLTTVSPTKISIADTRNSALTLTMAAGLFHGSVPNPDTGKPIPLSGVVFQKLNSAYGYFLGTNHSGHVFIGIP